jgi:hypothetical protein
VSVGRRITFLLERLEKSCVYSNIPRVSGPEVSEAYGPLFFHQKVMGRVYRQTTVIPLRVRSERVDVALLRVTLVLDHWSHFRGSMIGPFPKETHA